MKLLLKPLTDFLLCDIGWRNALKETVDGILSPRRPLHPAGFLFALARRREILLRRARGADDRQPATVVDHWARR